MSEKTAVDDYIAKFPVEIRGRLKRLRARVLATAVGAEEKLGYGIPTYKLGRNVFHFGAYPRHIGLYPGPAAIIAHAAELTSYKTSKGAIQIPHSEPLPLELVTLLIQFNLRTLVSPTPRRRAVSRTSRRSR